MCKYLIQTRYRPPAATPAQHALLVRQVVDALRHVSDDETLATYDLDMMLKSALRVPRGAFRDLLLRLLCPLAGTM